MFLGPARLLNAIISSNWIQVIKSILLLPLFRLQAYFLLAHLPLNPIHYGEHMACGSFYQFVLRFTVNTNVLTFRIVAVIAACAHKVISNVDQTIRLCPCGCSGDLSS